MAISRGNAFFLFLWTAATDVTHTNSSVIEDLQK